MIDTAAGLLTNVENLFPDQLTVYKLDILEKPVAPGRSSLLHQHFGDGLSAEKMKELIWEIALFLRDKEESSTYCFFYRKEGTGAEADWFLASAKLNACSKGFPEEIVVVSYNLQLLGDQKNRIYRVLNNGDFFKKHFSKVAALTKREKEVVRLLAAGMNSSEIAGTLCVSMHTVQAHRKNIIKKLDIRNFAGLLKFAEVFDLMSPNEHECPVN